MLPSTGVTCGKSENVKGDQERAWTVRVGNTHALRAGFGQDYKTVEVSPSTTPFGARNARPLPRRGAQSGACVCR